MADTLVNLFTCQISNLPVGVSIHPYFNLTKEPKLAEHRKCISELKISRCLLLGVCPKMMGSNPRQQQLCAQELARKRKDRIAQVPSNSSRNLPNTRNRNRTFRGIRTDMAQYQIDVYLNCLHDLHQKALHCNHHVKNLCERSALRSIKTVRLDMDTVQLLLQRLPNLRVLHLIRDPRAVALSRKNRTWSSGHPAKKDILLSADLYCQVVVRDILRRQQLQDLFPGSFMQMIYEDFTDDPLSVTENIYQFLNMTVPESVRVFVTSMTRTSAVSKWQHDLSYHEATEIRRRCKQLYELVNQPKWQ